jgi:hypothetical protein
VGSSPIVHPILIKAARERIDTLAA